MIFVNRSNNGWEYARQQKSVVLRMFVKLANVNRYVKKNIKVENLFA